MRPVERKEIVSWAMYDFANSAFATSVLTAIFPVYFADVLVGGARGAALWGYLLSASMLVVAVAAPFIGAITDATAAKKKFLFCFWLVGCTATALLGYWKPGEWVPAAGLFLVANIGFAAGDSLYNAFLPEIAPREKMDRVSGFGWGLGYLGGGICLALNLLFLAQWSAFVALWWFLFALPFFLVVKERARPIEVPGSRVAYGFRKVFSTLAHVRRFKELAKFLVAYLLFNDGVETVIVMAAIYGKKVLQMSQGDLIKCLLMIQGVALVGSFVFTRAAERLGSKRTLVGSLVIWCAVIGWAYFVRTQREYWILGAVVGTVLGGTQATARALMAKFTPPKLSGEFFGFFAIGGRFASVLGPLLFGFVSQVTGQVRYGVLSIAVFFILGFFLLLPVDERKGIQEAEAA